MKRKKKPTNHATRAALPKPDHRGTAVQPFMEHAQELRRRVYYVAASVVFWGAAIYAVQQHVVNALLRPAHGQHFIYTSVGGGVDFLFRISIYGGIVLSLPVIIYNLLRFAEPLMDRPSRRFVALGSIAATLLAVIGVVFGYYIGLPAALHFLLHQFTTVQIQPLVTIQAYLGFVIVYMFGSALLFQLPLLLLFINRIKPLKPKQLLHYERWVILAAFVLAGLMNPSPNILSQLIVAGPFIIAYQVAIVLIAIVNRKQRPTAAKLLREQDGAAQASRLARTDDLQPIAKPRLSVRSATLSPAPRMAASPLKTRLVLSEIKPVATRRPTAQQKYATYTRRARPFDDISGGLGRSGARSINTIPG